jgi:hypothetical protein
MLEYISSALRYVWTQPVIRAITLLMLLLNTVGPTTRVQLVLFAKQQFQASDAQVGLLSAAAAVGVLLASLGAGRARRWRASRMSIGGLLAQGLLLIAFGRTRHYWAALVLWALLAGLSVIVDINIMSLRQLIAPDHMLGRITAITRTLGFAAIPLNALIGGVLIDGLGDVAALYSAIGALTLMIGLGFSFSALARAES